MGKVVYVVHGSTGEYSDHRAWEVKAFISKDAADAMVARLNAWCKEMGCDEGRGKLSYGSEFANAKPPDDPDFSNDYTGTNYGVMELPLDES